MKYQFRSLIARKGLLLILLAGVLSACAANSVKDSIVAQHDAMADEWGVKVMSIRRTASDYMLDFRFRILDPKKASKLIDRNIKPHIIVERTGAKLYVPVTSKLGPLRQSAKFAKADKNYFVFFANPGKKVQQGDSVSVHIGEFNVSHLVVE